LNPEGAREITAGPNGNVWFTTQVSRGLGSTPAIGEITPSGQIIEFPAPVAVSDLTEGADGNLWFMYNNEIGKMTPSGNITLSPYPILQPNPYDNPNYFTLYGLTAGPDGNIWFVETQPYPPLTTATSPTLYIGKITPGGQITTYPLANDPNIGRTGVLDSFGGLTTGPDGKLYFIEGNQIGQVTLNGSNPATFVQIPIPTGSTGEGITAGPDGNTWFIQRSAIVKMSPGAGTTSTPSPTPYPTPTPTFNPTPTPTFNPTPTPTINPTPTPSTTPTPTSTPIPPLTPAPAPGPVGPSGGPRATRTVLIAKPKPGILGRPVTLTATVETLNRAGGTPSGLVTFLEGAESLGSVPLRHGKATLKISGLQFGRTQIRVDYTPGPGFNPSSAAVTENVQQHRR
jgi:hypothetical protein